MASIDESADALIDEFISDCEGAYQKRTSKAPLAAGFDPASIFTLILSIIAQMCPKPAAELKSQAERKGMGSVLATQSATRQALREKYPGVVLPYRRFNGDAIAESFLEVVASRDEAKIQAVQECCAGS